VIEDSDSHMRIQIEQAAIDALLAQPDGQNIVQVLPLAPQPPTITTSTAGTDDPLIYAAHAAPGEKNGESNLGALLRRAIDEGVIDRMKPQPSPTWDEVDAIRKGKSDIDLAERIWQLQQELRILKRAHGDALKEWAYAEGLLKELRSATAPLDELDRRLSERANRYMGTVEDYYLHGLWMAREEIKSLRAADKTASDKGQG